MGGRGRSLRRARIKDKLPRFATYPGAGPEEDFQSLCGGQITKDYRSSL